MTTDSAKIYTAFNGHQQLVSGPLIDVGLAVQKAHQDHPTATLLVFDDSCGAVVDLDLRGDQEVLFENLTNASEPQKGRYRKQATAATHVNKPLSAEPRGRGRPKLGVVAREVTLLPRQWEWLATQPGGASAVLRRLVDEAKRAGGLREQRQTALKAAYTFMHALAGDLPGYEEATRALFANDQAGFQTHTSDWPEDVRRYAFKLAFSTAASNPQSVV